MQFTKIATLFAVAATATAAVVEVRGGGEVCKEANSDKCKPGACPSGSSGTTYKCETIGLVNALNCFSLLDNNSIPITLTLDLLS